MRLTDSFAQKSTALSSLAVLLTVPLTVPVRLVVLMLVAVSQSVAEISTASSSLIIVQRTS